MKDLKELTEAYVALIENNTDPKKYFTKKKYSEYFENYCQQHAGVFEQIKEAVNASEAKQPELSEETASEDKIKPVLHALATALAAHAKSEVEKCRFLAKGNREAELNIFLITSIFPCNLRLLEDYGEALCDEIKAEWEKTFPGTQVNYSTFETLNGSFRKMFSFLTGR